MRRRPDRTFGVAKIGRPPSISLVGFEGRLRRHTASHLGKMPYKALTLRQTGSVGRLRVTDPLADPRSPEPSLRRAP